MTPFGRFPATGVGALAARAAAETLADAGAQSEQTEAIVFANATQGALDGQHGIRGQAALDGSGFGNAPVINVYGAFCRHHMATFGTTQRQMAAVSAKNHGHSVHNPRSQYRRSFSVDEV